MKQILKYGILVLTAITIVGCNKNSDVTNVNTTVNTKNEKTEQSTTKATEKSSEKATEEATENIKNNTIKLDGKEVTLDVTLPSKEAPTKLLFEAEDENGLDKLVVDGNTSTCNLSKNAKITVSIEQCKEFEATIINSVGEEEKYTVSVEKKNDTKATVTAKPVVVEEESKTEEPTQTPTETLTQPVQVVEQTTQYVPPVVEQQTTQYVAPTQAPTQAQTTGYENYPHMNILGIDYIYVDAHYERVCTSYEEIVQAMLDGFNYARHVDGTTEEIRNSTLTLDTALSADCKAWSEQMASAGKIYHSDLSYASKYTFGEYTKSAEGVCTFNIDAARASIADDGSLIHFCSEYENYVFYDVAFSAGKRLCYHISAQKKDAAKVGIGTTFGLYKAMWDSADYFACITIINHK